MDRFSLTDFPLENKTVLVRVDYNVPIKNGQVLDDSKIRASLATLRLLRSKRCKIILMTHLGRPQGKVVQELKTSLLVPELKKYFPGNTVMYLPHCLGRYVKEEIQKAKQNKIILLENLRFHKEEEENDPLFAQSLASLADVYVDEAFGVVYRKHASIEAITEYLPALAGLNIEKEIFHLNKALRPAHPVVWILGGAKFDKISLFEPVLRKADHILIGGALAFSFLKALKIPVGMSKYDAKSVKLAKKILKDKKNLKKIILPIDFKVAEKISPLDKGTIVKANEIKSNQIGLDIGPESIKLFDIYLRKTRTIVWNGPLGYIELASFATATKEIARYIGKLTATSIAGGGETAEAINKFSMEHNFTHVSTGGGAALAYLSGRPIVGLEALLKNYKRYKKIILSSRLEKLRAKLKLTQK